MYTALLLALLAPPQVPPLAAPAPPPQVPPVVVPAPPAPKVSQLQTYLQLRSRALAENVPLVVGVGTYPVVPTGYISCRWDQFPGVKPGIVVSVPCNGELRFNDSLPAGSSVQDVRREADAVKVAVYAAERARQPVMAPPFIQSYVRTYEELPPAHADDEASGPGRGLRLFQRFRR